MSCVDQLRFCWCWIGLLCLSSTTSLLHAEPAEKSWKHTINRPLPNMRPPVSTWLETLSAEISRILSHADGQHQLFEKAKAAGQDFYPDPQGVEYFQNTTPRSDHQAQVRDSLQSFSEQYVQSFSYLQQLSEGVRFDVNLAGSSSTNTDTGQSGSQRRPTKARYGLILTDIQPSKETRPLALSGPISQNQLEQATQAQVFWKIGRLETPNPIFVPAAKAQPDRKPRPTTLWQGIRAANLDFEFLDPQFSGRIVTSAPTLNPEQVLNNQTLMLNQKSGFYQLQWPLQHGLPSGQPTHQIHVPFTESMQYHLNLDQKLQISQVSLSTKIFDNDQLWWHLHQFKAEKRWQSEWHYNDGVTQISFISHLPGQNLPKILGVNPDERYELQLVHHF